MRNKKRRAWVTGLVTLTMTALAATAIASQPKPTTAPRTAANASTDLSQVLGPNWRQSKDVALQTSQDSAGYHLFAGRGAAGFAWTPLATLKPADLDAQSWTGYSCLTGSGNHVVAVVAPGDFANSPTLRDRGAFAYVVDVPSGKVHPVTTGVALTYFSPGCGAADTAVLTRSLGDDEQQTQLLTVDANTAAITQTATETGQLTSAVPAANGSTLAARGSAVLRIDDKGVVSAVGSAAGQVFDIVADSTGNATFLAKKGSGAAVYRTAAGHVTEVANSGLSGTALYNGRGGHAILVSTSLSNTIPANVASIVTKALPDHVDGVSLDGQVVVGHPDKAAGSSAAQVISTMTGIAVAAGAALGPAAAPTTATAKTGFKAESLTPSVMTPQASPSTATPLTAQSPKCAVGRNDPTAQVPQPGNAQVERAVDLATTGQLNDARPTNFLNMGLTAYTASSNFGPHALTGGGTVPAQVFLGILAQESNFKQASWHSLPGLSGNPLIADYYGSAGTINTINYTGADCGYGISQVTTGMAAADTTYSANGKKKIAVDYEENIAAGLQILEDKWNQLAAAGVTANNADPSKIDNWYMALWAYNTGYHTADSVGNSGLGWTNNPVNPSYPPNRQGYLRSGYGDASHPASWPYQERVFGWMESPIHDYQGKPSYTTPTYATGATQLNIPPVSAFCDASDNCNPSDPTQTFCNYSSTTDPLYYHCWWHKAVTWADCANLCATQKVSFPPTTADPGVKDPHPAECNSTLPAGAVIVDELANPAQNTGGCGGMNWTNGGTFTLAYGVDSSGNPIGAIDTHQIGAGFGGHAYFSHNRLASDPQHLVTGTWKANLPSHLYNVFAHMPSTGATTNLANYQITQQDGSIKSSVASQHTSEDQWVSLGYFPLGANAQVVLGNATADGAVGTHDVAWDALGFVPVSGTLVSHSLDAVGIFSENQDLNTDAPFLFNTPMRTMTTLYNWANSAVNGGPDWNDSTKPPTVGILNYGPCPTGTMGAQCNTPTVYTAAQHWSSQVVAAGSSPTNHPAGLSEASWMGFSVPAPTGQALGDQFKNDTTYKVKSHVDVQFLTDTSGNIVPGSQWASVQSRTGNTEIAQFVTEYVAATVADYGTIGVTMPDIGYQEIDANQYTGDPTTVVNPLVTGFTPGRAYMPHTSAPKIDGNCVQVRAVSGGSIGYRPLDAKDSVDAAMHTWTDQLKAGNQAGKVSGPVYQTAVDIYATFFEGGHTGSLFNNAAPIWQNIAADFCAGASGPTPLAHDKDYPAPLLVAESYMPDLYVYYDGNMIGQNGQPTGGPVQRGNFNNFSNIPLLNSVNGNGYQTCGLSSNGSGGNPWDINVWPLSFPDDRPGFVFDCDTGGYYTDTMDNVSKP